MKDGSLRRLAKAQVAARLRVFSANLRRASKAPENPDVIHDLRVSIRRLTQFLTTFASCFDQAAADKIHSRLRKLMDRCGEARNQDIALEILRRCGLENHPAARELLNRRKDAAKALDHHLKRWHKGEFSRRWKRKLKLLPDAAEIWNLEKPAASNAHRVLPGLVEELFAGGDQASDPEASHAAIHQFRLQVKRYRYAIETFESVYGSHASRQLKYLRSLQEILGRVSDCTTSLALVKGFPQATRAITGLLNAREAEFRADWKTRYAKPALRARWIRELSAPQRRTR